MEMIREQAQKIAASGILGRSRFYASLLEYLVACAANGRAPKELEIAAEVFGRGSDFDPSQDSLVRVYAHNLRQKLQQFYTGSGSAERWQLAIPKGEYRLALADANAEAEAAAAAAAAAARAGTPSAAAVASRGWSRPLRLVAAAVALLAVGLVLGMTLEGRRAADSAPPPSAYDTVAASPIWRPLLDDDLPILVVVGDYYIFGELDSRGNVDRLVREFSINSRQDLDDLFVYQPELAARYLDLDLTYLARSTAFAMRDVLRVLFTSDKDVRVVSMSELNVADFKTNHIVYLGYISALDKLFDFVFASSDLEVGDSYDQLINHSTGDSYTSEAGLPANGTNYRDFGLFSTFPGPGGNQFVIIAGTRDAGLMQTAQAVSEPLDLRATEEAAFPKGAAAASGESPAVELLFEVTGFDRTNLDAMIVHSAPLDYHEIWGGELLQAE